jgi:hypothetical protein
VGSAPDQVAYPLLDLVREVLPSRGPDRHNPDALTGHFHRDQDRRPQGTAPVTFGDAQGRLVSCLERSSGAEHRGERAVVRCHGTEQAIVRLTGESHDRELVAYAHGNDDISPRQLLQEQRQLACHALDRLDVGVPPVGRSQRRHAGASLESLEQAVQFVLERRHRVGWCAWRHQGRRGEAGATPHHEDTFLEPLDQRTFLRAHPVEPNLGGEQVIIRRWW